MKNTLKKVLFLTLFFVLILVSCEKDSLEEQQTTITQLEKREDYSFKKLNYSELKNNSRAFQKLQEAFLFKKSALQSQRTAYDEDLGFFIDTESIFVIENGERQSITLRIVSDQDYSRIENLVLDVQSDGSYKAYMAEYILTQEEVTQLERGAAITRKLPSAITEVSSGKQVETSANGLDCLETISYTVSMCYDSNGNEIVNNGEVGNDCVGMPHDVEYYITVVDIDCLSGGGSSGSTQGGDLGDGDSGSGWIGSGGNSDGSINHGSTIGGAIADGEAVLFTPTENLADFEGYTIATIPVLTAIDRTEIGLLNTLSPAQVDWYTTAPNEVKQSILDYLRANNSDSEALQFVNKFTQSALESGLNLDFDKSIKSPVNIDFSGIDTSTPEGQKLDCIYQKLMQSSSFKNLFENTFGGQQTKLNVKFEIIENFSNSSTLGDCKLTTVSNNGIPQQFNNLIRLKREMLDESDGVGNASNIKIAKVIIHELMHAYLNIKYKNCNQGASLPYINNLEIGELIQLFYDNFNCHIDVNGSPQSQHDFMYNFLIPSFQSILSECRDLLISQSHINYANGLTFEDSSLNINENWNWDKFFKYITLNGLHNCDSFTETTTNNPIENFFFQSYSQYENQVTKNCL